MFFLKKLISGFLLPVSVCAILLVVGVVLLHRKGREKWGRRLVTAGTILFVLLGSPSLTQRGLAPLEKTCPPVNGSIGWPVVGTSWICVLGLGYYSADESRPANLRVNGEYLQRIVEGVRLKRLQPDAHLAISVPGSRIAPLEKRCFIDELLNILGLPDVDAEIVGDARDTEEEIAAFRALAGTNRVLLVSSAYHLPRAMRIARNAGLAAAPAPSGFYIDGGRCGAVFNLSAPFPTSSGFLYAELAVHERLGLLWERLRGALKK